VVGVVGIEAAIPDDICPTELFFLHDIAQIFAERTAEFLPVAGKEQLHVFVFPYF
jgi:hypothetical protein